MEELDWLSHSLGKVVLTKEAYFLNCTARHKRCVRRQPSMMLSIIKVALPSLYVTASLSSIQDFTRWMRQQMRIVVDHTVTTKDSRV